MRSFYWLSLPFRNLSQCFSFFTIFRVLTNQTVFISQTNRLADLSEQNILLRLTKLDFWCTSAIVFLLSNFQPSSETDHFHLTRLPDHTLFFQLISRLTDETIIYEIRPHPGQDISSWVGSYGGLIYIYRILNEPCKVYVYFPHTFSGKTLDFLLRLVFCFVLF